ncbi:MAG: cation:proton antiporter domain-containing protein [Planctomycetaceae bacterium]
MAHFLVELVLVLSVSLAAVYGLRRVGLPPVVGFLLAGVLIGPGGLGLVKDLHNIERMAEIGVVFLLFGIGLHFSLPDLMRMKGLVFGAGALQVIVTMAAAFGLGRLIGLAPAHCVFLGALIALSSSAIVLKLLQERGETSSVHGRLVVGIAIFQDLAVVPISLLTPLLGSGTEASLGDAALALSKSIGMVLVILAAARYLFPWVLERAVRTRLREVFTLTIFLGVLGTALLSAWAGLSLALGAFLAGIVISESAYSQQILAEIAPIKDSLSSLFFVSVGMLVDVRAWFADPLTIFGLTALVLVLKLTVVGMVAILAGFPLRVAILAGFALSQVGEFSFVLASTGLERGLLDAAMNEQFLSVSVLTMALTPFAILLAPKVAGRAERVAWLDRLLGRSRDRDAPAEPEAELNDHVILVGYGVNGRNVARVLRQLQVVTVVIELNPHTVRELRDAGEQVHFGDASRADVLTHAGIARARALVLAISDPSLTRQSVAVARGLNASLRILVRTRYVTEVNGLYRLGADEVVPEEFETSLELVGSVLRAYGASAQTILRQQLAIREERYGLLLADGIPREARSSLHTLLSSADFEDFAVAAGTHACGSTLRALDLRGRTGATVLALRRGLDAMANPAPDLRLEPGDELVLFGGKSELEAARALLAAPASPAS